jgi:hypothetical protein
MFQAKFKIKVYEYLSEIKQQRLNH